MTALVLEVHASRVRERQTQGARSLGLDDRGQGCVEVDEVHPLRSASGWNSVEAPEGSTLLQV